jgi:hypothetical protein
MARITSADAQAWVERNRLHIDDPFLANDAALLVHIEGEVLGRLSGEFSTAAWVDAASTPPLVRKIVSMLYLAAVYRRQISQATTRTGQHTYSDWLETNAMTILQGILDGTLDIGQLPSGTGGQPAFYPNDTSSALEPTSDDQSLGDAHFSMGTVW